MDALILGGYRINICNSMNLPQDLQPHVAHPTLFVVADHIIAKIYLAGGDAIEDIDSLAEPRETTENDGYSSVDGIRTADPNADVDDTPRLKRLATHIAEHLSAHAKTYDAANIHLVMPADLLAIVKQHLSPEITKIIRSETTEMLMKEDILKVLRRIFG
jgi:hypothetical protein